MHTAQDEQAASSAPSEGRSQAILQCMLWGFISNTARLMPDGSYKTLMGNQTVAIHPSSVLFGRKVEAIVFNEFVYTGKAWARGVSAVQLDWISSVVEVIM
jgi:ATP-dependent RNA helicase DHR2